MASITRQEALNRAKKLGIMSKKNYFVLNNSEVVDLVELAVKSGYHKPKNANGSRGRYFFYYLKRLNDRS